MKKLLCLILGMLMLASLFSCGDSGSGEIDDNYGGDIGGDWHVWGMYDFNTLNGETIASEKMLDNDGNHIGYYIYADGVSSPGPLICEISCGDAGYSHEDMSGDYSVVIGDYNGDKLDDVGLQLKNGDILWYVQTQDEYGLSYYPFTEVEKSDK